MIVYIMMLVSINEGGNNTDFKYDLPVQKLSLLNFTMLTESHFGMPVTQHLLWLHSPQSATITITSPFTVISADEYRSNQTAS